MQQSSITRCGVLDCRHIEQGATCQDKLGAHSCMWLLHWVSAAVMMEADELLEVPVLGGLVKVGTTAKGPG